MVQKLSWEVCWGLPRPPQVWRFSSRTQHIIILLVMICHNERMQRKISKGKKYKRQSPVEPHRTSFHMREMLSPEKLFRDSVPRIFIGRWFLEHPLPSRRKQVFGIDHIVCIKFRHGELFLSRNDGNHNMPVIARDGGKFSGMLFLFHQAW